MKISVIAIIAILSLTFVTGCIGGAGGVQGVLDAQCNAMKAGDADAFSATYYGIGEVFELEIKRTFSTNKFKECSQKIISQETIEEGIIKAEIGSKVVITHEDSDEEYTQEDRNTRYFIEKDGKFYETI